jgi:ankyrin repeat protein
LSRAENAALDKLTTAINLGRTNEALALIVPGLPLDAIAKGQNRSPLFAAIETGDVAVVDALLAHGASRDARGEMGETPLHAAASKGSEAVVRALLARGAGVDARIQRRGHQYDGRTPLMDAACGNNLVVVKVLLEHGADPFLKDSLGMTALSFAEILGKRAANHLRKVMAKSPATSDLNLHDAARAGLIERVRALLASGTGVDARDDLGRTALHEAVMGGHEPVVQLLIDRGASPDALDRRGFRPLHHVERNGVLAKSLLAAGADPNAESEGESVLLHLAGFSSVDVLGALIDAGADPRARSRDGRDILDHAKSNPKVRAFLRARLGLAADALDRLRLELKQLPRLAEAPSFRATSERLGKLFNRKAAPWRRRKGVVYFHGVSQDRLPDLTRLQDEVRAGGALLVYVDAVPENGRVPLILLPATNKYLALLTCGTNGINKGHDTDAVVSWLMALEEQNPFDLAGCGHDFLHGRFTGAIVNVEDVARRMIEFCPDMVDQADASMRRRSRPEQIAALARELSTDRAFSFWWD